MNIDVGDTGKYIYWVITQSVDHISRMTGTITGLSVWYSINGGSATEAAVSLVEVSSPHMPRVYKMLVSIAAMVATAGELCITVTGTGIDPETRIVDIVTPAENVLLDEVLSSAAHNTDATVGQKIREIHAILLNKQTVSETAITTYEDDDVTVISTHTLQDSGSAVTKSRTT